MVNPNYVIDIEALLGSQPLIPHFGLLNPRPYYYATQHMTNFAVSLPIAGYANPHPGLKVPAVRSRHTGIASASNYVLFHRNNPQGTKVTSWRLQIEFLDLAGNSVTANSDRIDWAAPRFRLLPRRNIPAVQPPPPLVLSTWKSIKINFV